MDQVKFVEKFKKLEVICLPPFVTIFYFISVDKAFLAAVIDVNPGSFVDILIDKKQQLIPATYPTSYLTKLYWKYGGKEVLVTGSFNDWSENLPLVPR